MVFQVGTFLPETLLIDVHLWHVCMIEIEQLTPFSMQQRIVCAVMRFTGIFQGFDYDAEMQLFRQIFEDFKGEMNQDLKLNIWIISRINWQPL